MALWCFFSILCVIPPSQNIPLSPKNALKSSLLVTRQNEAPSNMAPNIALDLSNGSTPKTKEKRTKKNGDDATFLLRFVVCTVCW